MLLLAAIVFFSLSTNTFLTANNLQNVSRNFAWITIPAFGESLVIIVGGIDLSVGAVMALSGLITALALRFGLPIPLALVLGLLSGGIVGWINGIIFGLAEGWPIRDLPSDFRFLGQANVYVGPLAIPVPLLITIILAVLVYIILSKTVLGRYIFSLGDNEQALIVTGVGLPGLKTIVYTLCGALTAVGGILMTARLGVAAPTAATGYELNIIAAVIIGGTSLFGGEGSALGVLLGAAFMQIFLNGLVLLGLPAYWQSAALGSMIFLGLLLDLWRQNRTAT